MSLAPVNTTLAHTIFHVPSMDIFPTKWRQIYRHLLLIQEQAESNQHPHFWPWGWAEWVTESSFLVESSIQLPSKAETWGLIATICLRAITLTKKMKSYKLLNRRNTRKTGQKDQILYHAWNSLSLNNFQCIQLTSQKVWDKGATGWGSHWSWTINVWVQQLRDSVWMLVLHFLHLQPNSTWENLWEGFFLSGSFFTVRFILSRYF